MIFTLGGIVKKVLLILPGLLLAGCASNDTLYEWGTYQPSLTQYMKDKNSAKFETELRETIAKGEQDDAVPPGVYAELGYLLYKAGKDAEASEYFRKEKAAYPESAMLMDKLIDGNNERMESAH